jgi:hypothetical protein
MISFRQYDAQVLAANYTRGEIADIQQIGSPRFVALTGSAIKVVS